MSSKSPSPIPSDIIRGGNSNKCCYKISLEPMMFLHMIALTSVSVIQQNLYLDRICRISFGFPDAICSNLTGNPLYEKHVETEAAQYTMYRQLTEAGFPVVFSLFVGPWSDKYGTKLPIMFSMTGFFISGAMYFIISLHPDLPPYVILFCAVPVALTGGIMTVVISVFSHTASTSNEKNRSYRIAMIEGAWWLGAPIGLVGGAEINKYFGMPIVFMLATIMFGLALLCGFYFMVEEPIVHRAKLPKKFSLFCGEFFNLDAVRELLVTSFRKREGLRRSFVKLGKWIMILVATLNLRLLSMFGMWNIMYLFTRNRFGWEYMMFSEYSAIDSILGVIGLYTMVIIAIKWLKLSEPVIGLIGCCFLLASVCIFAVSSSGWMIYLASVVQMPANLLSTAVRSMLSKCVSKKELGKIYSFLASGEAFMPLISAPLYSMVYENSISTYPGAVFLLSVGFVFIMLFCFIYLVISSRNFESHEEIDQAQQQNENGDIGDVDSSEESESEMDDGIHMHMRKAKYDKIEIIPITT